VQLGEGVQSSDTCYIKDDRERALARESSSDGIHFCGKKLKILERVNRLKRRRGRGKTEINLGVACRVPETEGGSGGG